jgi:hypothetical protein
MKVIKEKSISKKEAVGGKKETYKVKNPIPMNSHKKHHEEDVKAHKKSIK